MPLSPGTALQNGHYVIDALLDAAPNGDLYWGTHVVSGMQVFIQIFPVANVNSAEVSGLIARWQGVAFSPRSPLPNPFQLFHGEDNTLCLAMGTTIGLPWSQLCNSQAPYSPKQALSLIRSIAAAVNWLHEQGIQQVDLSPNRVWLTETGDRLTLTGLPYPHLSLPEAEQPAALPTTVQSLARLLYSFFTGKIPLTSDASFLKQSLQQQMPSLSPLIVKAIYQGMQSTETDDIAQWLTLLPPDSAPAPVDPTPNTELQTVPTIIQQNSLPPVAADAKPKPRFRKRYPALAVTAVVAAVSGISLGTFWRLNAENLPGALQLDPNQSFPSQADWSGDTPEAAFDEPFVPAQENPERQQDWVDTEWETAPSVEVWEAPANAYEAPAEVGEDAGWEVPEEAPLPEAELAEPVLEEEWTEPASVDEPAPAAEVEEPAEAPLPPEEAAPSPIEPAEMTSPELFESEPKSDAASDGLSDS